MNNFRSTCCYYPLKKNFYCYFFTFLELEKHFHKDKPSFSNLKKLRNRKDRRNLKIEKKNIYIYLLKA